MLKLVHNSHLKLVVDNNEIQFKHADDVTEYLAKNNPVPKGLENIMTKRAMVDRLNNLWDKNVESYEGNNGKCLYKIRIKR